MPTRLDHGYSVKRSNEVLRGISIYSGDARGRSSTDYHVVRVGMKVADSVEWLATWDQRTQAMGEGAPLSILPSSRGSMRLHEDSVIVVELTTVGFPAPIRGSSVDLDLSLTGGSTGGRRPLVSLGSGPMAQPLADAVNRSGVAEKVARIPLDDVREVSQGAFEGRLQRDSATQVSLQRYVGNWIEVDGSILAIGSSGLTVTTSDGLLVATGTVGTTAPSASTLYYAYVGSPTGGSPQLRLSATAPSGHRGVSYLGTDEGARRWRFVGWVRLNASTQFVDDTTDRLVVNFYNRLWKPLVLRPAYSDGNSATSYTTTSTSWTAANAGTGATASYIANGEDGIHVTAHSRCASSLGTGVVRIGIGDNSGTSASVAACRVGSTFESVACSYATVPATGYRTLVLLVSVSGGTGTFHADDARNGSTADPVVTGLVTRVAA